MTLFTLCGNLQPVFNLMLNVQVAGGGGGMNSSMLLLYGDRAADELGHPDATTTYPGKFGKFYLEAKKKLAKRGYQCILSLQIAIFSRKQHFDCNTTSIS